MIENVGPVWYALLVQNVIFMFAICLALGLVSIYIYQKQQESGMSGVSDIYVAHKSGDGKRFQSVEEHNQNVANKAAEFAADFGQAEEAHQIGLVHDIGKTSREFQNRILHDGPIVDHATAGAMVLGKSGDYIGAMCVAGHHSGLLDYGSEKVSAAHDGTFCGRVRSRIPAFNQSSAGIARTVAAPPLYIKGDKAFSSAFLTRMLYSCLVDADYLDTEAFMNGAERAYSYDSMDTLLSRFYAYVRDWLENRSKSVLNITRTEILRNCLDKGHHVPTRLYSLTIPTG